MKITVEYNNNASFILPQVSQADFAGSYSVLLTFSNGVKRIVDFGRFLKKSVHPTIRSYLDENNFKKFKVERGNIVWGENWDLIFPIEQLYEGKIKI